MCATRTAAAVLISQLLSIALATTGVSSQALTRQGIFAPTAQAWLNYAALAAVFGTWSLLRPAVAERRQQQKQQQQPGALSTSPEPPPAAPHLVQPTAPLPVGRLWAMWPSFAALALLDVEANFLVTKAYQYTSLTSVTLLDCATIPVVMALSCLLLRARYRPAHYAGAAACILGLAVLVLGDAAPLRTLLLSGGSTHGSSSSSGADSGGSSGSSSSGSAPLLGDVLVLAGALLYGACNVAQELLLADVAPGQLLGMLGLFGAAISGAQALALEHGALAQVLAAGWSPSVAGPLLGFAAALFLFYSLVPQVLLLGGATVLNLGLLSSDLWAALARCVWLGGFSAWAAGFFAGALVLVVAGLVTYTAAGSPTAPPQPGDHVAGGQAGAAAAATGRGSGYSRVHTSDTDVEQAPPSSAPG